MFYDFPVINTIDDVLPYIIDCEDFYVTEKESFIVINYRKSDLETFPPVVTIGDAIRRECRGIIFDSVTRKIISRPYHKFFNYGEREETFAVNIDLSISHVILDKLDGSFIRPFITSDGVIHWGTKMVAEDFERTIIEFVSNNPEYIDFGGDMCKLGNTPIFEWMSPENRIVLDYGSKPSLVLELILMVSIFLIVYLKVLVRIIIFL